MLVPIGGLPVWKLKWLNSEPLTLKLTLISPSLLIENLSEGLTWKDTVSPLVNLAFVPVLPLSFIFIKVPETALSIK